MAQIAISALRDLKDRLGAGFDINRFIDVAEWGAQLAAEPIVAPMPFHPDPDDFPDADPDFENDFVLVDGDTLAEDLHRALAPIGRAGQAFAPAKRFHGTDDDFDREPDGSVDMGEPISDPTPVETVNLVSEPQPTPAPVSKKAAPTPAPAPKKVDPAAASNDGTAWSEAEDRTILTGLFRDNLTQGACAKLVNRSESATKFRFRVLQGLASNRVAPPHAEKIILELTGGPARAKVVTPDPMPERVAVADAPAASKMTAAQVGGDDGKASPSWTSLTLAQRALVKHLEKLSDDFAPQDDLDIASGLFDGQKAPTIAINLGVTPEEVVARFKLMKHRDILDPKGHLTIDGQRDLIVALRYRVSAYETALAGVVK